eukprot:245366_1
MWRQCQELEGINAISDIIVLNENEFICMSTSIAATNSTLWKYNVNNDTWEELLTMIVCQGSLCLNGNTNMLYHYTDKNLSICDLNVKHKTFVTYETNLNVYNDSCLIANDELHLVGGYTNRNHLIWDSIEKKFISQYTFDEWKRCIEGAVFVHIPSRNMLLLLGGYDAGAVECLDTIWKYCLQQKKWEKLYTTLPSAMRNFGCIVTANEKYVIVFGGSTLSLYNTLPENGIHVLDLDTFETFESKVKCPQQKVYNEYKAARVGNTKKQNIVICGFIRRCWSQPEFDNIMYPSDDIIKLMQIWYAFDDVHLMAPNGKHWKINISHI